MDRVNQSPLTTTNQADTFDNPYKVLVETIKNPFELEEIDQSYKEQEVQYRQNLSEKLTRTSYPGFFKTEKNILAIKLSLVVILFAACLGALGYMLYSFFNHLEWFNNGYFALDAIIALPSLIMIFVYGIHLGFLNKEIKNAKIKFNPNAVSSTVQSVYKHLVTSFSNINWWSFYVYLTAAFAILVIFIVSYFAGIYWLGGPSAPHFAEINWEGVLSAEEIQKVPAVYLTLNKISVIVICTVAGTTLVFQVVSQILNLVRMKKIEASYNTSILSEDEKVALRKAVNKRNLIIFCVLTVLFALILLVLWLTLRRRK